ncbi:hypothetical protein CSKR_107897, partial [Clonorchis sinensis]
LFFIIVLGLLFFPDRVIFHLLVTAIDCDRLLSIVIIGYGKQMHADAFPGWLLVCNILPGNYGHDAQSYILFLKATDWRILLFGYFGVSVGM